jgi:hypothetical protein
VCRPALFWIFPVALISCLASCGSNGDLYNGSGGGGTAAAALQIASVDIAQGNYSGAISSLSPYCPNNNCVNSDIGNAYANAYLAMGNTQTGTAVTGSTTLTGASTMGATVTQILTAILNLIGSSPTNTQIMQALDMAIPCLANNTCNTFYLDNLATALAVLANTPCSGSPSVGSNCPDSSTTLIVSAVYLLVYAQYDTGLTYANNAWERCNANGGGLSGCTTSLNESTLDTELSNDSARLANVCEILGGSGCTGTPSFTFSPTPLLNAVASFSDTLPSGSQTVSQAINQFLNAIAQCSQTGTVTCAGGAPSTAPYSQTLNSSSLASALAYYLSQL